MIVFASPIHDFSMTAQMEAAIQRVYCIGKPVKAQKMALLLRSGSPDVFDAAIAQIKSYTAYAKIELAGVITANGDENKSGLKHAFSTVMTTDSQVLFITPFNQNKTRQKTEKIDHAPKKRTFL